MHAGIGNFRAWGLLRAPIAVVAPGISLAQEAPEVPPDFGKTQEAGEAAAASTLWRSLTDTET